VWLTSNLNAFPVKISKTAPPIPSPSSVSDMV
jgi:hypothetical protein